MRIWKRSILLFVTVAVILLLPITVSAEKVTEKDGGDERK